MTARNVGESAKESIRIKVKSQVRLVSNRKSPYWANEIHHPCQALPNAEPAQVLVKKDLSYYIFHKY